MGIQSQNQTCETPELRSMFEDFKKEYGKVYNNRDGRGDEEQLRFKIFTDNVAMINKHNSQGHSWTMEINKFSDMTGIT